MSHVNAALTPRARLRLARLVVDQGWTPARAAERYDVSWRTAAKWAQRYRDEGPAGMADRSSRPHHQPARTPSPVVRKIVHLRWKHRLGPVPIADRLDLASSTVHAVLVRCRINRLTHIDRATGEPIRRYEHEQPGDLIHVDVKKLGRIPDGGGHKVLGRQAGRATRASMGFDYVHSAVDDHSRLAYSEIHGDEKAATCADFLRRAAAFFATAGIDRIERVLTDNAWPYRKSFAWRQALADLGAAGKLTRAYRPQTNGKVERFHRTLSDGWAFARHYNSEQARRKALPAFLHHYNHHRPHTATGGLPPITRLTNVPGQHT